MSQLQSKLIWLKDVLDHLRGCQKQLEWTTDPQSLQVLTETMLRDLDCCRKLCESLHRRMPCREAA